ncbi:MAG: F0F1 ATP synthase subunit epsilon [Muribaculaceae bacterium]|jgi:F-type H+-transporting ATPase subunit epsilon|nr:F0F1 ATP synthase subunit epsilon [Muribaculaceae bacterium]MBR5551246.1 F0F1 ATP synthase subunit epsilon [Muribaculaceae bacterium]
MILKIISTEDVLFDGEVELVTLPGQKGSFTVLNNHASIVSSLVAGNIVYSVGGVKTSLPVDGGLVDVDKNVVSVCIY